MSQLLPPNILGYRLSYSFRFNRDFLSIPTGTTDQGSKITRELAFGLEIKKRTYRLPISKPQFEVGLDASWHEGLKYETNLSFWLKASDVLAEDLIRLVGIVRLLRYESSGRITLVRLIDKCLSFSRLEKFDRSAVVRELLSFRKVEPYSLCDPTGEQSVVLHTSREFRRPNDKLAHVDETLRDLSMLVRIEYPESVLSEELERGLREWNLLD